ncbi:HIT family protein [Thiomonas bhubaneswarensis]|uniref:Diadenosine tetraphosphate (Ap4A) hydrolase or other HIT family hydrolase n=1 Tax=Thiomonas bhubaneswarensis TaxID=339866 RepID=A0A0K6I8R3_9BURK|nr:HIT family protein [Thiomonas bhubaneswarensis]CUA99692.1 Diadenosine tetraphosphate (Ap4A) hydrolase or other HIT family hydrolase [Thiomonas bhubaneswarensis]
MNADADPQCPFCREMPRVLHNELAFAVYDRTPVNPGHMLLIPFRHVADWFDCTEQEQQALLALAAVGRDRLQRERQPDGFNLGVNCGPAAGQSIFHVHLHLIPRYRGDMADPLGGVRGVIPARQKY